MGQECNKKLTKPISLLIFHTARKYGTEPLCIYDNQASKNTRTDAQFPTQFFMAILSSPDSTANIIAAYINVLLF